MTTPYASEAYLHQILGKALSAGATDVHLKVGQAPGARVRGDMVFFKSDKLTREDMAAAAGLVLAGFGDLESLQERVLPYHAGQSGRFRATIYRQRGSFALVFRPVPAAIPNCEGLGLPGVLTPLTQRPHGLIVVAGGACSGRSTSIAALLAHLRDHAPRHIVTLEDPIEFLFNDGRASISQRQIGADTESLVHGIGAALRSDADLIVAANLDTPEALFAALDAVDAGRLVLAGFSAPDVPRAFSRLVSFAKEEQTRLVDALEAIVAQRLVPRGDGKGFALAVELLVVTPEVREALHIGQTTASLRALMDNAPPSENMQTFAHALRDLAKRGVIKG